MGIKSNLRMLMAEHRIDDISDLMNRSGLSRNAVNRIYKGDDEQLKATSLKTLIQLCDVFQCKLSDLLEYAPDEKDK